MGHLQKVPPMSQHVFTYGSLMFAPVWQRVVRGDYAGIEATLQDHARFALIDALYPGMVALKGHAVVGTLYCEVSAGDLSALDRFEGDEYQRCRVQVELANTKKIWAQTYLFLPHQRLSEQPWNPANFALANFLNAFLPRP